MTMILIATGETLTIPSDDDSERYQDRA
jgi:hypothetical protein